MERLERAGIDVSNYTQKDRKLVSVGFNMMEQSVDEVHGIPHVLTLAENYVAFRKDTGISADERVLGHTFVFHDTWKALRGPGATEGLPYYYEQVYEGLGSAFIFKREAEKVGLEKDTMSEVFYAIRKHSLVNLLPRLTTAAKIVFDMDELHMWDPERFIGGFEKIRISLNKKIAVAMTMINHRTRTGFYFDWSRNLFEERRKKILEYIDKSRSASKLGGR